MPDPTPALKILLERIELLRDAVILEQLAGGPTSDSWRLRAGDEEFMLRLDQPFAGLLGLDRHAELKVLQTVSAAGIGPKIIWADPDKGVLLTSFIPGSAWRAMDVHNPGRLEALARTLRRLHALPPRGPGFKPGKMALTYASITGTDDASRMAEQATSLAARLLSETVRPALCHNDLVHGNIIGRKTVRLIDWEYAAVGDPYFDLAIVVRHHQLKEDLTKNFLSAYFGTAGKKHFTRLEAFCRLYDQLAALWYLSITRQPGHDAPYDEELERVLARMQGRNRLQES